MSSSANQQIDQAWETLTMAGVTKVLDTNGDVWMRYNMRPRSLWNCLGRPLEKVNSLPFSNLLSNYGPLTPLVEGQVINKPVVVPALYSKITTVDQLDVLPDRSQVTTNTGAVYEKKGVDVSDVYKPALVWRYYNGLRRVDPSLLLETDVTLTWLPKDES